MSFLAFCAGLALGALGGVCIGLLLPTVEEQPQYPQRASTWTYRVTPWTESSVSTTWS